MTFSTQIKPISYLKSHAAEIIKDFADKDDTLIITQNGEAKMVVMDIAKYERQQDTLTMLKILAYGAKEIEAEKFQDASDFFAAMDGE
ncbi:type II toxin-antitoxin system Phd/YefM family antitoxin [Herbaspirillum lusitanum]|uniref:Antitoxin n=1 Tax=Herbaspirillum lusitanum TaxID=213312 RepID=A0ABW9A7I2_9BURK